MIFTPYDVLSIPEAVQLPYMIIKSIAYILFPILFVLHVLQWIVSSAQTSSSDGISNWYRTIFRAILIFIALAWYRHIFMKIVALSEVIAMSLIDTGKVSELIIFLTKQSESYVEGAIGGTTGKVLGTIAGIANAFKPKVFLLGFLATAVAIAEPVLLTIRYALLSILYVFGPIAIVGNMFKYTKIILKGWFNNLIQISFWIVILRILESVMLSLQIQSLAQRGSFSDILAWIIICTIFLGLIIMTPILTAKIFSGDNLGEVGSMAAAAATIVTTKYGGGIKEIGQSAKKGISNTYTGIKDRVSGLRSGGKSTPKETGPKEQPRR